MGKRIKLDNVFFNLSIGSFLATFIGSSVALFFVLGYLFSLGSQYKFVTLITTALWGYLTIISWFIWNFKDNLKRFNYLVGSLYPLRMQNFLIVIPIHYFVIGLTTMYFYSINSLFSNFIEDATKAEEYIATNTFESITLSSFMIVNFLVVTLIAPIVEELFYRGFLLQKIARRWNIVVGLIVSSLIFGFLHIDPVGSTALGVISGLLYLKTKSLYYPILLHIFHNLSFFLEDTLLTYIFPNLENNTSTWQTGVFSSVVMISISLPLIFLYFRSFSLQKAQLPYLENQT